MRMGTGWWGCGDCPFETTAARGTTAAPRDDDRACDSHVQIRSLYPIACGQAYSVPVLVAAVAANARGE